MTLYEWVEMLAGPETRNHYADSERWHAVTAMARHCTVDIRIDSDSYLVTLYKSDDRVVSASGSGQEFAEALWTAANLAFKRGVLPLEDE